MVIRRNCVVDLMIWDQGLLLWLAVKFYQVVEFEPEACPVVWFCMLEVKEVLRPLSKCLENQVMAMIQHQ